MIRWHWAAIVFCFFWIRPVSLAVLQHHWPPTILVPELMAMRYHDEALYASRVNQILIHGKPYNPYWREHRGLGDWLHQSIAMYAMAGFAVLAGGNLNLGWMLAAAVLGAAWFLLFHAIFFWWTRRSDIALPTALASILFPDFYHWCADVNFDPGTMWARWSGVLVQRDALIRPEFYRLPSNFLTLFLFALLLVGMWKLLKDEDRGPRPWSCFAMGLGFGLMSLVHAYEHVAGLVTLGVMAAVCAVYWRTKPVTLALSLSMLSGALASTAAYCFAMHFAVARDAMADALLLSGLHHSHHFVWVSLIHLAFAFLCMLQIGRRQAADKSWAWGILCVSQIAIFICRNQQVITGVTIQPFHFIPIGGLTAGLILALTIVDWPMLANWWEAEHALYAVMIMLPLAVANESWAARATYRMLAVPPETARALAWVKANVPVDGLVLSLSAEANEDIPLYTSAKVMAGPTEGNQSSPFDRREYFQRLGSMLGTMHANPHAFLRDMWLPHEYKSMVLSVISEAQADGYPGTMMIETAMWFYPQYAWDSDDAPMIEGKRKVMESARTAKPIARPYWEWLGPYDWSYLRDSPEAHGGKLVYDGGIKIYEFR